MVSLEYDCDVIAIEDATLPSQRIASYRIAQLSMEDREFNPLSIIVINPCGKARQ